MPHCCIRDDLNGGEQRFVLLYAYNGTGKTRLSMEFKDTGKRKNKGSPDTFYFNAFTEDLFYWDNDLANDSQRVLRINSASRFFSGIQELALEEIRPEHLWGSIAEQARIQDGELLHTLQNGFKYIETESFASTFRGLFSEINLGSEKLGKTYVERNSRLSKIVGEIAKGLTRFSTDNDTLGDAYEYGRNCFMIGVSHDQLLS